MTAIWSAENRYRIWWQIEVFAAEAMGKIGMIPAEDAATIRAAYDRDALGEIDIDAIDAIEAVTKHDVIAFLTWAGEKLGPERRWLHQGMTSTDVLDTALAVQLKQSAELLLKDIDALLDVLKRRAFEHKLTPTIGRSHGIHAEPTTFGLKLAQAYAEFDRNAPAGAARDDDRHLRDFGRGRDVRQRSPAVEEHVAAELGLTSSRSRPRSSRATAMRCSLRRWRHRLVDRAAGDRDPPPPADRSARSGGIFLARAEGQLGDAAQAQSGSDRESDGACPNGAQRGHSGAGECRPVARAGHFPLFGRALHRPRRHDHPRFRARPADQRRRQARSSTPSGCRRTSTAWAASFTRSA